MIRMTGDISCDSYTSDYKGILFLIELGGLKECSQWRFERDWGPGLMFLKLGFRVQALGFSAFWASREEVRKFEIVS